MENASSYSQISQKTTDCFCVHLCHPRLQGLRRTGVRDIIPLIDFSKMLFDLNDKYYAVSIH